MSSLINAALTPFVRLTISSMSSREISTPRAYNLVSLARPSSSGSGNSIAWSIRPGRDASAGSIWSGRFVVRMNSTSVSSRSPSISFSNLFRRASSPGPRIYMRPFPGDEIDIFDNHHGRLQKTCQPEIFVEQPDLFRCHQQGRVVRELRRQIVNRVGLAGARRPVEQEPLPRLKRQRFELLPSCQESSHIAVKHVERLARQDHILAAHSCEPMYLHQTPTAHRVNVSFKREDAPPVSAALRDLDFQIAKQVLRKLRAAFSHRNGNFNLHPAPQAEASSGRHHNRER